MRQAIGYIRVSTPKQAATGQGMDMQRHHIDAYAQLAGYRITQISTDVGSGMGEGSARREGLRQAIVLAQQSGWPIIVSGFDRIARNTKRFEEILRRKGVKIISAYHGEGVDPVVVQAAAVRAQREGERISETTKRALNDLKARGVKLGNPTNLDEAQRKGAAKNRALGKQRRAEFEEMLRIAKKAGATSAAEIAADLNARGFRTARGGDWRVSNVHRMLSEIGAAPHTPTDSGRSAKPVPPPKSEPIFDASGYIRPDGTRRVEQIMDRRDMTLGDVMEEIGGIRRDASLAYAMSRGTRFNTALGAKLIDWVHKNEQALGLS